MNNSKPAASGTKRAITSARKQRKMTRTLSSSASSSATVGGVTATDTSMSAMSAADRLLSQDSGIDAKDLVDTDSIALPLSLIKGLRRKSSSIGIGSMSSGGCGGGSSGGSGNNSDNSALVSLGNNSFGFNFDSEEGMMNGNGSSSPPNSDGQNGESEDSDGNGGPGVNDVTASSANGNSGRSNRSGMTGGVQRMEVDGTPASVPCQVTTKTGGTKQSPQHLPPESKPSSSSLNSQRSGSGSGSNSDSGGDVSGSGTSGSGSTSGNGTGSRSSGKSTVSSLTMSSNSGNGTNDANDNDRNPNPNFGSGVTEEAAADAAVARLQSIASAYTPQNKSGKDAKKSRSNSKKASSKKSKKRKKAEDDDDEEDNDSGGYNSDDEGGMAASRRGGASTATGATPDVTASLASSAGAGPTTSGGAASASAAAAAAASSSVAMAPPMAMAPPAPPAAAPSMAPPISSGKGGGPPKKKAKTGPKTSASAGADRREERNQREKERSFRISRQINDLRNLLSSGGVIVPKGTKSAVLTEAANYIRMLQQHQYKSEIDRHQLIQQMQMIGGGALGTQAATAVRHVAAQNGVWSLGNFGGVPPRSAMTYYQQSGPFGVPGSSGASQSSQQGPEQAEQTAQPQRTDPQLVTKIDEHEYRFVFNSCSVGMAIASMGGAFIDCNNLFCQLSQYTKQEVCAMTIFNLTSRQDLQHAFDLISRMISPPPDGSNEGGEEANPEPCVLRGAMKHRNDLGLSISLIKGEDGIAKCFCVTLIKNPSSPFDTSRQVAATADLLQGDGLQFTQPIAEEKSPSSGPSPPGNMPAYTTG